MRKTEQPIELVLIDRRKAKLSYFEYAAIFREQADDRAFAMLGRHGRDANIDVRSGNAQMRGAILRQATLGNVQPGQDLDAGE